MIKVITHTDLDGIGCAIIIKELTNEELDISYCSYGNINDVAKETLVNHEQYSKIYITDISVNNKVAKLLDKIKDKVILLDHHKTALDLNKYEWANVIVENDKGKTCGTSLVFDFLRKEKDIDNPSINLFVELVRRYDTWEWDTIYNDESAKKLNNIYYLKDREDFFLDIMNSFKNKTAIFSAEDLIILEYRQKEIDRYIKEKNKQLIRIKLFGYKVGVVLADNYISELGNSLSKLNPEVDFIAMVNQKSISYRTDKDNVDVSKIAKRLGGGGHSKAAGSPISEKCIIIFIIILFHNRALKNLSTEIKNSLKKVFTFNTSKKL